MNAPTLSIIVPTHNRADLLMQTLRALSKQSWPAASFEVIVVADSCEDETHTCVTRYAKQAPYQLQLISHQAHSAAATRNLGAKQARGDVLLFLDDDVVPRTMLVQAHMEAQHPHGIVLGYSKPVLPARADWFQYDSRRWWEDTFKSIEQPDHRFTYRDLFSGNLSMSAGVFREINGFDLSFTGRLEDYELGLRMVKAGVRFRYAASAIGDHYDSISLRKWLQRIQQEGAADIMMGQRHPELRYALFGSFESAHNRWRRLVRSMAFAAPQRGHKLERVLMHQAALFECVHMRQRWRRTVNLLREYRYWRGVAWAIEGKRAMFGWLQEAPIVPAVAGDAPAIDLAALPAETELRHLLDLATRKGVRVLIDGCEVLTLAPQAGAEPLRLVHLKSAVRSLAKQQFIPALALQMAQAQELAILC
jgi:GT2 family glycosyltransferase